MSETGNQPETFGLDMHRCFVRDTRVNQSIEKGKKAASCLPAQWFDFLLVRAESIFCNVGDREQTNNLWIRYASMLC